MRRDKINDIPFAWYWEGRPLRSNQIRPVYTGTHSSSPYQCAYLADPVSPSHSHRSSRKTKEFPYPEPDCCSGARREVESCGCSLCNGTSQVNAPHSPAPEHVAAATAAASSASCSSAASDIHYHSHAYFCCSPDAYDYGYDYGYDHDYDHDYDCNCDYDYPRNTTQSSSPSSCSCCSPTTSRNSYHSPPANPTDRCPCSTCSPSPSSSSSRTRVQMHYEPRVTDTHHGHHRRRRRSRSEARRSRGGPSEDDSATMSGYTDSSMYSDCSMESDVETESCQCFAPAYREKMC